MKFILFTILSILLFSGCSSTQANDPTISIINGYTVPPMPDKELNNATLLGVDIDNNGIRDDVDRYIAETYAEPIQHDVAEMAAKVWVDKFKDPENAYEKKLYMSSHDFIYCRLYLEHKYDKKTILRMKFKELDDMIMNTEERIKAFWMYNSSLSGKIFDKQYIINKKLCPKNIQNLLN